MPSSLGEMFSKAIKKAKDKQDEKNQGLDPTVQPIDQDEIEAEEERKRKLASNY